MTRSKRFGRILERLRGIGEMQLSRAQTHAKRHTESSSKLSTNTNSSDEDWLDTTDDPNEPKAFQIIGGLPPLSEWNRIHGANNKKDS